MAKIPFNIEFKPQIESGEYKVETRDGRKARIIHWDLNCTSPIVAVMDEHIDLPGEIVDIFSVSGRAFDDLESPSDLFIITPEPELTEFEKKLSDVIGYAISLSIAEPKKPISEFVKEYSAELLALARKELVEEQYTSDPRKTDLYKLGKAEALKDLPRWSPNDIYPELNDVVTGSIGTNDHFFIHRGRIIHIESLEKLPGFKED